MNQPTEDRIKRLEERMEQLERETEPMRLERRLSIPEANTLQAIQDMVARHGPDIAIIKGTMATKQDLQALKMDMEKRFDAITEMQKLILARLPKPPEGE